MSESAKTTALWGGKKAHNRRKSFSMSREDMGLWKECHLITEEKEEEEPISEHLNGCPKTQRIKPKTLPFSVADKDEGLSRKTLTLILVLWRERLRRRVKERRFNSVLSRKRVFLSLFFYFFSFSSSLFIYFGFILVLRLLRLFHFHFFGWGCGSSGLWTYPNPSGTWAPPPVNECLSLVNFGAPLCGLVRS